MAAVVIGPFNTFAQTTYTWTGGGGPANQQWSKNNNWSGVAAPANNTTNYFVFSGAAREFTPSNDRTNLAAASIVFATNSSTNAQSYNLVGNSLRLLGGVTNLSTRWHTISLDLVLAASSVQFDTAAGNLTLAGRISGDGSLAKNGTGTVTISGANTYSGGTLVSAGALSGDTTSLQGNITNNASVIFDQMTNGTYAGVLSGTGTLLKTSAATLILSGANTQSGGTFVGAGTLQIGNGGTTGSLAGAITNNASLIFNRSDNTTQSGAIGGSGSLTKNGAGTVALAGANTFTGATIVSAGTLNLNSAAGSALGSTASVSVSNGATLLVSRSNQVNNSAAITLSGGTIRRGTGVSEVLGNINLTTASFLDFGTGAPGTLSFGTYTPSALLTVGNFFQGNVLSFQQDLSGSINNPSFFVFDNNFTTSWNGSNFTITAIPEPSTFAAAAALLGIMIWPSRRLILRDFKRIVGFRAPMRDRLARMCQR